MDQNYRTVGSIIVVVCLTFSAFLCLGLGVALLSSYPHELWWLGVGLTGGGVLLVLGSVQTFRSWKREHKASQDLIYRISNPSVETVQEKNERTPRSTSTLKAQEVLANWVYSAAEWQQFMHWEQKDRRLSIFFECIWIVVLGTLLLTWMKGASITIALLICVGFAVFYGVVKYLLTIRSIEGSRKSMPEVVITSEAALINGRLNRFYGENLWLGKVDIKEAGSANILEITYWWNTRKGKTFDELRVPVPKGKLREAIEVQQALTQPLDQTILAATNSATSIT